MPPGETDSRDRLGVGVGGRVGVREHRYERGIRHCELFELAEFDESTTKRRVHDDHRLLERLAMRDRAQCARHRLDGGANARRRIRFGMPRPMCPQRQHAFERLRRAAVDARRVRGDADVELGILEIPHAVHGCRRDACERRSRVGSANEPSIALLSDEPVTPDLPQLAGLERRPHQPRRDAVRTQLRAVRDTHRAQRADDGPEVERTRLGGFGRGRRCGVGCDGSHSRSVMHEASSTRRRREPVEDSRCLLLGEDSQHARNMHLCECM